MTFHCSDLHQTNEAVILAPVAQQQATDAIVCTAHATAKNTAMLLPEQVVTAT
ncbi:hypothetical protein FLA_4093 [Filimonas lacunae]|nr:hypothetical protein FLA_4093 [Filimonas lacunae]